MTRSHFLLRIFLCAALGSPALAQVDEAPRTTILDQGRLEYRLKGERCGHEDFVIEHTTELGFERMTWRGTSQLQIGEVEIKMRVRAVYAAVDGKPTTLESLREEIDAGPMSGGILEVRGKFVDADSKLVIEHPLSRVVLTMVDAQGRPVTDLTAIDANGGYVLYAAVAAMAPSTPGQLVRKRTTVPQAQQGAQSGALRELTVELLERQGPASKVQLVTSGSSFLVRLGANGRLEKVSVPEQSFEAVRVADRAEGRPGSFAEEAPPAAGDDDQAAAADEDGADERIMVRAGNEFLSASIRRPNGSALGGERGVPGVLLLSRAGAQDRDGQAPDGSGGQLFAMLADALAARGIASLRFDDPGIGESTGSLAARDLDDRVADAVAVFGRLERAEGVDGRRLAVLGHEEGGVIALRLAVEERLPLASMAMLATPSQPFAEVSRQRAVNRLRGMSHAPDEIDAMLRPREKLFSQMRRGRSWRDVILFPSTAEGGHLARELEAWKREAPFSYYRQLLDVEPGVLMLLAEAPMLIATGGKDAEVPPSHAREFDKILRQAGKKSHELRIVPHLDHHLAAPGMKRADPSAVDRIAAWFAETFR